MKALKSRMQKIIIGIIIVFLLISDMSINVQATSVSCGDMLNTDVALPIISIEDTTNLEENESGVLDGSPTVFNKEVIVDKTINSATRDGEIGVETVSGNDADSDFVANTYNGRMSVWDGTIADSFAGGDGSKDNPYQIETAMQLAKLTDNYYDDKCYVLIGDILLNDIELEEWYAKDNINAWTSIENFSGTFDGQGHSIYGLYGGSLFGKATGIIQNICIKDAFVFSGYDSYIGAIAGYASTISGCSNSGIVQASGTDIYAGGIAGYADVVTQCYNEGGVYASGNNTAGAGGIVGCSGMEISDCYNTGDVNAKSSKGASGYTGYAYAGGIVGSTFMNSTQINNCYDSNMYVSSTYYYCGGIVGLTFNSYEPTLTNCYCLASRLVGRRASTYYGNYSAVSCNTLTEDEMKQKTSFEGFDFVNIWSFSGENDEGHPVLRWEISEGDIEEPEVTKPNLWYFMEAEELFYNHETGYNVEQFNLDISATYMNTDGSVYKNCILTTELPEGLSFARDEDIRTISETIEYIDDANNKIELTYPIYITTNEYIDKFDIMLNFSADGYEESQTYSKSFEVSLEKEENTIMIFTTEKSLSVKTGDSMWLAFGLFDTEADKFSEWKKMAVVVSDPSIIELSDYKETEYGYSLEVIGKKQGSTNVVITDASNGASMTIQISVYDEYVQTYSYDIDNMPSFYPDTTLWESLIKTNIYNLNGLYVNNYSAKKNTNTNKYTVSFDVYNSKYYYGAIDIYDQNGNWIDYEEIKKFNDITSLWETGEQAFYLITDTFLTSKLLTYEQASFAECTHVSFEVPENGYFTISNNIATSPGTYFANAFEILFDASTTALDLTMSDSVKETAFSGFADGLKQNLTERMVNVLVDNAEVGKELQKIFLKTMESEIRKATKNVAKAELNYIISSSNDMYSLIADLTESILGKIEWKSALQTSCGVGESVITKLSGSAGIALKGCFSLNKGSNKLLMAVQMAVSTDNTYAKVYSNTEDGHINHNGVVINTSGNVDSEAVLQVFRISNNDTVDVILNSDNPLETYELYNICFVKNDQLVQPSGKVTVYVPIPDEINGNTCKIYRQEADGAWTILDAHIEGNYLVFETEHFSLYALVGESKNINIYSLPINTTYIKGDILNTDGLVIDIDGTLISEGFICTPNVLSGCGAQRITVIYGSATTDFDVMVTHTGGIATCSAKAVCSVCSQEYGEVNADNHINTEIRNAVVATTENDGYSGDVWCIDCNTKIANGTVIKKIEHTHVTDIALDTTTVIMNKGDEVTLNVTVSPGDTTDEIVWSSTDESVATVSADGVVTAIAAGEATITATTTSGQTATCVVTVKEDVVIRPVNPDPAPAPVTQETQKGVTYKVNGSSATINKIDKNATTLKIPATITTSDGQTYKVTRIAKNAAKGNTKLTKVVIGSNVTTIGDYAFSGCTKLKSVTIGKNVVTIGNNAFYNCKAMISITIPKKVKTIGKNAFYNCTKLKTVKFASGSALTTIKDKAFYKCSALTKVTIPAKVTTIGKSAFASCTKLGTLTIGKKVTTIEASAFNKCISLKKVTIPANVKKIGASAFSGCKNLKNITIKTTKLTTKNVGSKAFSGINAKATIKVPAKKLADYKSLLLKKGVKKTVKIKK